MDSDTLKCILYYTSLIAVAVCAHFFDDGDDDSRGGGGFGGFGGFGGGCGDGGGGGC